MFCKNCGKENITGGEKCEFCGFEFSRTVSTENPISTVIKRNFKKEQILHLVLIVAVLVMVIAFFTIGNSLTKPEKIIEKYMAARMASDYETIYKYLDVDDNEFLSKEIFLSVSEKEDETENYKIISIDINKATEEDLDEDDDPVPNSKVDLAYKVIYITQENLETETEIIYLRKTGKKFLLFNDYKINPNKHITTNYSFDAPAYAQVVLDGIKLDEKYYSGGSKGYVIPKMFDGTHSVVITSDYTEDYKKDYPVSKYNRSAVAHLEVKDELYTEMVEEAKKILDVSLDGVLSQKSWDDVASQLAVVENQKSEMKDFYNTFCTDDEGRWANQKITDVYEKSIECYISHGTNQGSDALLWNVEAPLKFKIKYCVTYDKVYAYGSFEGSKTFLLDVSYTLEDGKLKIYSIKNTEDD